MGMEYLTLGEHISRLAEAGYCLADGEPYNAGAVEDADVACHENGELGFYISVETTHQTPHDAGLEEGDEEYMRARFGNTLTKLATEAGLKIVSVPDRSFDKEEPTPETGTCFHSRAMGAYRAQDDITRVESYAFFDKGDLVNLTQTAERILQTLGIESGVIAAPDTSPGF